jgi:hypothetical protein
MILGFAHITKNRSGFPFDEGQPRVVSAPEKWPLMARRATSHRLFKHNWHDLSEEVIDYDTGTIEHPGRLDVVGGPYIIVRARESSAEHDFLRDGFGFEFGSLVGSLELNGRFAQWDAKVIVSRDQGAPVDPPLDIEGYAALAFYCSDVEADLAHLLKHGGRTPTEPFTVKLNREMKIVMLRSPEGTIIELIQVMP